MRRGLRTLGVTSHRSGWKGLHALILLMFLWPGWSEGIVSSKATRLSCEALNGTEVKPFHPAVHGTMATVNHEKEHG